MLPSVNKFLETTRGVSVFKKECKDLSFCEHLLSNETVFFHLFFGLIQIGLGYGAFLWFPLKERRV